MENSKIGVSELQNPWTDIKFGTGDMSVISPHNSPHANIHSNSLSAGVQASRWNVTFAWFLIFSFLWPQISLNSRDQTAEPIFTLFDSQNVDHKLLHS